MVCDGHVRRLTCTVLRRITRYTRYIGSVLKPSTFFLSFLIANCFFAEFSTLLVRVWYCRFSEKNETAPARKINDRISFSCFSSDARDKESEKIRGKFRRIIWLLLMHVYSKPERISMISCRDLFTTSISSCTFNVSQNRIRYIA